MTEADRFARWCAEKVHEARWKLNRDYTHSDGQHVDNVRAKLSQARTAPSCDPSGAVREQET